MSTSGGDIKPPRTVTVGPHDYSVDVNKKRATDASIVFAQLDRVQADIIVNPDQSPSQMRDSVLHEVIHAICDVQSCLAGGEHATFRDDDAEERFVRAFSPLLLDTLRRNPNLTTYLLADGAS